MLILNILRTFPTHTNHCSGTLNSNLVNIDFLPLHFSKKNPSKSINLFEVFFRSFKKLSSYLYIRYIIDREHCLSRVCASHSSTPLLRVLGNILQEDETSGTFYFIGCDISSDPSLSKHVLLLTSGLWIN